MKQETMRDDQDGGIIDLPEGCLLYLPPWWVPFIPPRPIYGRLRLLNKNDSFKHFLGLNLKFHRK